MKWSITFSGTFSFAGGAGFAPLPQRPYTMTNEQNTAIVQAQVDAHFGPKLAPPPKEKVPEKVIDHFIRMAVFCSVVMS